MPNIVPTYTPFVVIQNTLDNGEDRRQFVKFYSNIEDKLESFGARKLLIGELSSSQGVYHIPPNQGVILLHFHPGYFWRMPPNENEFKLSRDMALGLVGVEDSLQQKIVDAMKTLSDGIKVTYFEGDL